MHGVVLVTESTGYGCAVVDATLLRVHVRFAWANIGGGIVTSLPDYCSAICANIFLNFDSAAFSAANIISSL
jgi:hypothetical protein